MFNGETSPFCKNKLNFCALLCENLDSSKLDLVELHEFCRIFHERKPVNFSRSVYNFRNFLRERIPLEKLRPTAKWKLPSFNRPLPFTNRSCAPAG